MELHVQLPLACSLRGAGTVLLSLLYMKPWAWQQQQQEEHLCFPRWRLFCFAFDRLRVCPLHSHLEGRGIPPVPVSGFLKIHYVSIAHKFTLKQNFIHFHFYSIDQILKHTVHFKLGLSFNLSSPPSRFLLSSQLKTVLYTLWISAISFSTLAEATLWLPKNCWFQLLETQMHQVLSENFKDFGSFFCAPR